MDAARQTYGLVNLFNNLKTIIQVPVDLESVDSERSYDSQDLNNIRNIPYDPDLINLNKDISNMKT